MQVTTTTLCLHAGLAGMGSAAGTGEGSCKAPPYRAETVAWPEGCPDYAPCCSEYGYCHARDR